MWKVGHKKLKTAEIILLIVGAIAGVLLRYKMISSPLVLGALPVNVLFVNMIGSFILGAFSIISAYWNLDTKYTILVAVGFCGSLTTMSSFALETSNLIDNRLFYVAAINILANVGLSLGSLIAARVLTNIILLR
jgi:fluoride exporter